MRDKRAILSALARKSYTGLQRWAERRTAWPEEAADITQEAFARVFAHADFAAITNLRAFLYEIASHLIIDEARKRELLVVDPAVDLDELPAQDPSLEVRLDIERRCDRLLEALTEVPTKRRHVFLLHRFERLSYAEIAEVLGISTRTVETHIRLALAHCRRRLDALE